LLLRLDEEYIFSFLFKKTLQFYGEKISRLKQTGLFWLFLRSHKHSSISFEYCSLWKQARYF